MLQASEFLLCLKSKSDRPKIVTSIIYTRKFRSLSTTSASWPSLSTHPSDSHTFLYSRAYECDVHCVENALKIVNTLSIGEASGYLFSKHMNFRCFLLRLVNLFVLPTYHRLSPKSLSVRYTQLCTSFHSPFIHAHHIECVPYFSSIFMLAPPRNSILLSFPIPLSFFK